MRVRFEYLGIAATLAALACGYFVLIDDMPGFRRPEAFATLLSAVFSMISTSWLVVTVFRQGYELRLQRDELRLQRGEAELQRRELELQRAEATRLANEADRQNTILSTQANQAYKSILIPQVRALFEGEQTAFNVDYDRFRLKMAEALTKKYQVPISLRDFSTNPEAKTVEARVYKTKIAGPVMTEDDRSLELPYEAFGFNLRNYRYRVITAMAQEAAEKGALDWFRTQLPFVVGAVGELNSKRIAVLLNAAAASVG
ncbi:hypothetical protein ACLB0R_08795 [Sphingomonas sp. GlSt437]|uniref:hypothetical protein n=1 Tax=Sphingomonas sp. GlSt437 TaxID=3389970 RepID=UPI003A86208C